MNHAQAARNRLPDTRYTGFIALGDILAPWSQLIPLLLSFDRVVMIDENLFEDRFSEALRNSLFDSWPADAVSGPLTPERIWKRFAPGKIATLQYLLENSIVERADPTVAQTAASAPGLQEIFDYLKRREYHYKLKHEDKLFDSGVKHDGYATYNWQEEIFNAFMFWIPRATAKGFCERRHAEGVANVTAYEPAPKDFPLLPSADRYSLLFRLIPTPLEDTPIEKILDFRADRGNRLHYLRFDRWMRKFGDRIDVREFAEEYEYLRAEYTAALERQRIKYEYSIIELVAFNWFNPEEWLARLERLTKGIISSRKIAVENLGVEHSAKGSETAYITRVQKLLAPR